MGIADWFGNAKHKKLTSGPHTGTGDSGGMMKTPKVTFRTADGKKVQPPRRKKK